MNKQEQGREFWNGWSTDYARIPELVMPYQDAQREFAGLFWDNVGYHRPRNPIIVGFGEGTLNQTTEILKEAKRRHIQTQGLSIITTDYAPNMIAGAGKKVQALEQQYQVHIQLIQADSTDTNLPRVIDEAAQKLHGMGGEVVGAFSSWNVDYHDPEARLKMLKNMVAATGEVPLLVSSMVQLPDGLTSRKVLTPLGMAQVLAEARRGSKIGMKKSIAGLTLVKRFGKELDEKVNEGVFPVKPSLVQLQSMGDEVGDHAFTRYQLYGASAMLALYGKNGFDSEGRISLSKVLVGKEGYPNKLDAEVVTFASYFNYLCGNSSYPGI